MAKNNSLLLMMVAALLICLFSGVAGYYIKSEEGLNLTISASGATETNKGTDTKCEYGAEYLTAESSYGNEYHVYAQYLRENTDSVIGLNGKLYLVMHDAYNELLNKFVNGKIELENGMYEARKDTDISYIIDMGIDEKDVYSVSVYQSAKTTGEGDVAFVVFKDGTVKMIDMYDMEVNPVDVFTDFKVSKVLSYKHASSWSLEGGNFDADITLLLTDGTTQPISNFN